jgi:hypothetical protein
LASTGSTWATSRRPSRTSHSSGEATHALLSKGNRRCLLSPQRGLQSRPGAQRSATKRDHMKLGMRRCFRHCTCTNHHHRIFAKQIQHFRTVSANSKQCRELKELLQLPSRGIFTRYRPHRTFRQLILPLCSSLLSQQPRIHVHDVLVHCTGKNQEVRFPARLLSTASCDCYRRLLLSACRHGSGTGSVLCCPGHAAVPSLPVSSFGCSL